MQFKLYKLTVTVSFSFFALILFAILSDKYVILGYSVFFSFLHELVHLFFIIIFKSPNQKIKFWALGAEIKSGKNNNNSLTEDFVIHVSAPVFNILTGVVFLCLNSSSGNNLYSTFAIVNLFLGIFNLLPFYTFDGANALTCILCRFFDYGNSNKIIKTLSILTLIIMSVLALVFIYTGSMNYSVILFVFYMLFVLIFK